MDNINVKLTTNWLQNGGVDLTKVLQVDTLDEEDNFYKHPLKDIIREDRTILLCRPQSEIDTGPCELCIQLTPRYKIRSVHCVCNAIKMEIFQGQIKEYKETIYGELVNDDADDDDNVPCNTSKPNINDDLQVAFYRYDVEVEKSGITELTIRFLTTSPEVCIFGIILNAAPNPNGITTLMANPSININMENVQNILDNIPNKISPSADKCRQFLEIISETFKNKKYTEVNQPANSQQSQSFVKTKDSVVITDIDVNLRNYIDSKFMELEQSIQQHLLAMEKRQEDKLTEMLNILQTLFRSEI